MIIGSEDQPKSDLRATNQYSTLRLASMCFSNLVALLCVPSSRYQNGNMTDKKAISKSQEVNDRLLSSISMKKER